MFSQTRHRHSPQLKALTAVLLGAALGAGRSEAQAPSIPPPAATAALHVAAARQPIYGFGGTQTYAGDALADFPGRDKVYQALFQDLKIDIYRLRNYNAYPGEQEKFDRVTRDFADGARKWGSDPKTRGGKAPVRLMFTSWSPPPALKSNGLVSGRSDGTEQGQPSATLKRGADGKYEYAQYADWWLDSLQQFKTLTGGYPDYIALQNELEFPASYEGCLFLPTEGKTAQGIPLAGYSQALTAVSARLTGALGLQSPKILGPETFSLKTGPNDPNHVIDFVNPATAVGKEDLSHLFGVSFHIYGAGAAGGGAGSSPALFKTGLGEVRDAYRTHGVDKPLFENEFLEGDTLTAVAGIISDTFTEGDVSAYLVWIAARNATGPGYALVYYNPTDGSIERRERFYAVKAFSEFVGEGWHRIDADCSDPAVKLSAYVGPAARDLVAVLVNPTTQPHRVVITPDGDTYKAAGTSQYRSTEGEQGEHWRVLGPLPADSTILLPPHSVLTVKFSRPSLKQRD